VQNKSTRSKQSWITVITSKTGSGEIFIGGNVEKLLNQPFVQILQILNKQIQEAALLVPEAGSSCP
jgi:hypothetical protein